MKFENSLLNVEKKYSVLMSLYYKESPEYFRAALDSMVYQTIQPDEIVLVKDGPISVELEYVINEFTAKYPNLFSIIQNEKNMGLGISLSRGLNICKNEFVARMDTDDIALLDRCEKQLEYFQQHPEVTILGGQIEEFINEEENIIGKRLVPINDNKLKQYMKKRCPFNHMTVMFRKSDIIKVGNYKHWEWNEDYYLWIRLSEEGFIFANLPDTLVHARVGLEMYQRRGGIKYFRSEKKIQRLMLEKHIISYLQYVVNISVRLVIQVLMPGWLRGIIFRKFARS